MEVSVEELVRVRASGDTGPSPRSPYEPNAAQREQRRRDQAAIVAGAKNRQKSGREREYKRDPKGSSTGGQFTRNPSGATTKTKAPAGGRGSSDGGRSGGGGRSAKSSGRTPPPLEFGARNDPDRVRFLQRLLKSLKIGPVVEDGIYGEQTERAVMALQRKLGLTETGRVSNGLLKRIRDAEILSPCRAGAKRSKEMDELDELIRAVMEDVDCDCEDKDNCDCDDEEHGEGDGDEGSYRSHPFGVGEILRYDRMWALDDIVVRSGGDGRTVEAYAAVFDVPTEIKDQHGHYMEVISRSAFNRAISHGIDRIGVFYHHGMTLAGTPSDLGSVPIGSPLEVRPDGRGLRTVSRFNRSALADSVLEAIRAGDIKGYSFRGKIFQSDPKRIPRGRGLATITRTELGLSEYGPTPTPYYADAGIVAVRSPQAIAEQLTTLDEPFRRELITILSRSTPQDPEREDNNATSTQELGAEDPPQEALRSAVTQADIQRRIAVWKITGGKK